MFVMSADGTRQTITVTITGTNDAPVLTHSLTQQTTDEDATFSFSVPTNTFTDIDHGDTLTLSASGLPAWLHFDTTTGHHTLSTVGNVISQAVQVDTSVATPNPGSLLHLNPMVSSPADSTDTVTDIQLTGLLKGTILSDGQGHTHIVTGTPEKVDIHDWTMSGLTAQLPPNVVQNMNIGLIVTTTGADGTTVLDSHYEPLILDPTKPVPDVVIGGEAHATLQLSASHDANAADLHLASPYSSSDEATTDNTLDETAILQQDDRQQFTAPAKAHNTCEMSDLAPTTPLDHYLQMVGISHSDITPPAEIHMGLDLPETHLVSHVGADADMLDALPIDPFDNPLFDDDHHKNHNRVMIEEQNTQLDHNPNDDDLLHSALNDMHNQM